MYGNAKKTTQLFTLGIILCVTVLCVFGLITLWSFDFGAGQDLFAKQLLWIAAGSGIAFYIARANLSFLSQSQIVLWIYFAAILLLLLVLFFGDTIHGSQSWFNLFGFSLQPSEFAKIALILILAKYLSRRHIATHDWKHIFILVFYMIVPLTLVFLQPDLGSGLVLLGVWLILIFLTGISRLQFFVFLMATVASLLILWFGVLADYQKDRIISFVSPLTDMRGAGYNAYQSLVAVGSGQTLGKGIAQGSQSRLHFLPESETDFIFASFSEEWGFVGASTVLILFAIFLGLIILLSQLQWGNFQGLFLLGAAAYFFIHICVNIGMNINLLPITGIPLPFLSYGGSHILTEFITLGIILNFAKNKNIKLVD